MELFDQHFWTKAGDLLFGAVITKGYVLAGLILSFGLLFRGASAAMRAALWTAGAAALLVLPLIVGWVPVWELGVAEFPQQLFRAAPGEEAAGGPGLPEIGWLALLWVAGSALLLGRFLLHLVRITLATRRADPARGRLAELADSVASDLRLGRVRVALGDAGGVPLTWGLRRPVVLLPREAARWPVSLQRAVLHHEMAHIERRDYAGLLALELCRVVHWPNPFVWYLVHRARMDQELACDDAAIRSGIAPADYARHLVAVARTFATGSPTPVGALPVLGVSPLATRVQAAMERGANRGPLTLRAAMAAVALIALTAVPVAVTNLWSCPAAAGDAAVTAPAPATEPAVETGMSVVLGAEATNSPLGGRSASPASALDMTDPDPGCPNS